MSIVISCFGVQSPLGCSFEDSINTLHRGERCIGKISNYETTGYDICAAGEIRDKGSVVKTPMYIDRKVHFLDIALAELLSKSHFKERYSSGRLVMNMGCGVDYLDIISILKDGEYLNNPLVDIKSHHKSYKELEFLSKKYGVNSGCHVLSSACTASAQAIGMSYRMLKHGLADAAVTGGTESMISHLNYIGFYLLGVMASGSPEEYVCKPFDRNRKGTVLGEGAITMLIEKEENVLDKSCILAEIVGYASTMDAYAITDPDPSGHILAKAIKCALKDADITPEEIDCAHLHGTGTPKNAIAEYKALREIFGSRVEKLPVYSMKGQVGHLIGACTAIEMLGAVDSIINQHVLPTVNYNDADPDAPLFVVKDKVLKMNVRYVLKINSAFGGHNSAIILKKWEK